MCFLVEGKSVLGLFSALIILVSGCICSGVQNNCVEGSGNVVSRDFTVDEFEGVSLSGSGNMYVTQDTRQSLRIEAEDNVLEALNVEVAGGKLTISHRRCIRNTKPINVHVMMKDVRDLSTSGSGEIIGQSKITSDALKVSTSGSGSSDLNLKVGTLNTQISGSGDADLRGTAKTHNIKITGAGDVYAPQLSTETTKVTITGSGKAEVDASEDLDVTITGSGTVIYTGDAEVSQKITGSGKIEKRD